MNSTFQSSDVLASMSDRLAVSFEVVDSMECGVRDGSRWTLPNLSKAAGLEGLRLQLQAKIPDPAKELTDVLVRTKDSNKCSAAHPTCHRMALDRNPSGSHDRFASAPLEAVGDGSNRNA